MLSVVSSAVFTKKSVVFFAKPLVRPTNPPPAPRIRTPSPGCVDKQGNLVEAVPPPLAFFPRPTIKPSRKSLEIRNEKSILQRFFFLLAVLCASRQIRLLHREVELLLQGVDKQGNLFGAVLHPKGDVRHELLKQGLARMVDWSLVYVTRADALAMRQAENEGKRSKLRLWREWSPPQIDGEADYPGVVVEVHSGDQISVTIPGGAVGQERRLALSSIRAPRVGNPRRGVEDEPWAVEAREALRKLVIGRSVKVVVDYQRDIPKGNGETTEKRAFATVTVAGGAAGVGGKCLQEVLVEMGMAGVARLRQDDPRTEHYDAIVAAEAVAKAGKKGMHSGGRFIAMCYGRG